MIKQNTHFLFSTPIYINSIKGQELENVQFEIQENLNLLQFEDPWNNERIKISDKFFAKNHARNLKNFNNCLSVFVGDYLKSLNEELYNTYEMKESWLTKSTKGNYGHIHTHGSFDISGVYYFKTNENDGNIFFENPVDVSIASKIGRNNILRQSFSYTPQIGKFILFPSWLRHGVDTNTTDNERISVSFNLSLSKKEDDKFTTRIGLTI